MTNKTDAIERQVFMDSIDNDKFLNEALPTYFELETIEQIEAITDKVRYRMLLLVTEKAMTSAQLARALNITRQRAYYHLKVLEKNKIVHLVGTKLVGEMLEKYYRAYGFIHSYTALVNRYYQTETQPEINRLLKAVNNFVLTLVNEARDYVLQDDFFEYFQLSYQFDSPYLLTPQQAQTLRTEIITLCKRYLEIDHQNRLSENRESFIRLRNSVFLSPVPKEFTNILNSPGSPQDS
jgi:DNA-binding transcriptional ArsR family regulator